jgi:hypothetical protein
LDGDAVEGSQPGFVLKRFDGSANQVGGGSESDFEGIKHRLLPCGHRTGLQAFPKTFRVAFLSTLLPADFFDAGDLGHILRRLIFDDFPPKSARGPMDFMPMTS